MTTEFNNQELSLNEKPIFTHGKVTDMDNRPIINGDMGIGEVSTSEGLANKATSLLGSVKEKIENAFENVKEVFTHHENKDEKFEGISKNL
jgi:hypothetical protein